MPAGELFVKSKIMIKYQNNLNEISSEMLKGFFVGWATPPTNHQLLEILKNSYVISLAIDEKKNMVK